MNAVRYPRSPAFCWPSVGSCGSAEAEHSRDHRTDLCWPPLHSGLANRFIFKPSVRRKTEDFVLEQRVGCCVQRARYAQRRMTSKIRA